MTYEKGIENLPIKRKTVALRNKKVMDKNHFDITDSTKEAIRVIADAADKAANKIDVSTEKAATLLATAADKATSTLASAAKDASALLASNASDAMKVSNTKNEGDHDLLTQVDTKLKILINDIKEYKNEKADKHDVENLKTKLDEYKKRTGVLEGYKTGQTILMSIGIGLLSLETGLIIYLFMHLP